MSEVETEQKKEPEEKPDPESIAFWERLGKEITTDYKKDIENLMKSDTKEHNGETFKFKPVANDDIVRFKKLDKESFKIADKDSQEWYDNVKERALILIEDMTPEKFNKGDSVKIENMVTAWSTRAIRGFHR